MTKQIATNETIRSQVPSAGDQPLVHAQRVGWTVGAVETIRGAEALAWSFDASLSRERSRKRGLREGNMTSTLTASLLSIARMAVDDDDDDGSAARARARGRLAELARTEKLAETIASFQKLTVAADMNLVRSELDALFGSIANAKPPGPHYLETAVSEIGLIRPAATAGAVVMGLRDCLLDREARRVAPVPQIAEICEAISWQNAEFEHWRAALGVLQTEAKRLAK
jgi:hypothetical protein